MAAWRPLRAVGHNFLGVFTSRNVSRGGWWLHGLAEASLDGLEVDLLADPPPRDTPAEQVAADAIFHFADQMKKHDVAASLIAEATLHCRRGEPRQYHRFEGAPTRSGHDFEFKVQIRAASGQLIEKTKWAFVAPHDPQLEQRAG